MASKDQHQAGSLDGEPKDIKELVSVLRDVVSELREINSTLIEDRALFAKMNNDGETVLGHVKNMYKTFSTTEKIIGETVHTSISEVIEPLTEEIEKGGSPEIKRKSFLLGLRDILSSKLTPHVKKPTVKK